MTVCTKCKTENKPGDRFCTSCGESLVDPITAASDLLEAGVVCPSCDAFNESNQPTCVGCGQPLIQSKTSSPPPPVSKPIPPPNPVPAPSVGALRLLSGYGLSDSTFAIPPEGLTVGRKECSVSISDDPFLSPKHLKLSMQNNRLVAEDLGSYNGVFLRLIGGITIQQGAEFIAGHQRLLLLGLGGPTTDVRTPASSDTRPYGGPTPMQLFIALRQLHVSPDGQAFAGAVILRSGPAITIGQHGCDINYLDDPVMAPSHAELQIHTDGVHLIDCGSLNGVFVKIRVPTPLQSGNELMVGREVFRVDLDPAAGT
jgi:pSer/pThr/pTyr-binding forkhead associated (FHA) protein